MKDIENLKKFFLVTKEDAIKINKYEEYEEVLSCMVFLHLCISWVFLVSYNQDANMKEVTKDAVKYMDENFPKWRKIRK